MLYLGDMMRIFMSGAKPSGEISQFGFKFNEDSCDITIVRDGVQEVLTAANRRHSAGATCLTGLSCFCSAPSGPRIDTLRLVIRNIEGCHKKILNFTFKGTGCLINEEGGSMFMGGAAEPVIASLI
jgi:hypothetical protein